MLFSAPEHLIPDVDAIDGQRRTAFPITVPQGELRSIIVDFFMPEAHPSGNFSANVRVLGDSAHVLASHDFTIEIFNVTLPSTPALSASGRVVRCYGCMMVRRAALPLLPV